MRSYSIRLAGAAATLALLALPTLAVAQEDRAPAPPAQPAPSSPATSAPSPGSSYTPSMPAGDHGSSSYGGVSSGSTGGRYDGGWRSGYSTPGSGTWTGGTIGRGNAGPPPRVELPAPRLDPPSGFGARPVQPLPPGVMPRDPRSPVVSPPMIGPGVSPPDRVQLGIPGFGNGPGRVGGLEDPRIPRLRAVEIDRPDAGRDEPRVIPPPDDPVVINPGEDKRKAPQPKPPTPVEPTPPSTPLNPTPGRPDADYWLRYGYGYWYWWQYQYLHDFGWWSSSCWAPGSLNEENEFWYRATGSSYPYSHGGCGYGYGYNRGYGMYGYYGPYWVPMGWFGMVYGGGYGGYPYGYGGYGSMSWLRGNACVVVSAETYSGRLYRMVAKLPQYGSYGPVSLKRAVQDRLEEDGEVALEGHGSQELHLYAGFVKNLRTRWCGPSEW